MARIAVLGAGYMGSAVTFPLAERGHEVRLWGTWLDDELVRASRAGRHPRLKRPLPPTVEVLDSGALARAVQDADAVFIAIASEGFVPVFERLLPHIGPDTPLFCLTKGFIRAEGGALEPAGGILRVSEAASLLCTRARGRPVGRWAAIGGPVKAVELADGIPTGSVYGLSDPSMAELAASFRTPTYRTIPSADVTGVELCAALKNAYAIALGICDGMYGPQPGRFYDNAKAFLLGASVLEMGAIVEAAGGSRESAAGLPGAGDLYVTAQSGRNRKFGELIGSGIPAGEAYSRMNAAGEIAEGYHALLHGRDYIGQLGGGLPDRLPLFRTLHAMVCRGESLTGLQRLFESYPQG
jgi:glycerol-3-phosphate dehydrogenase (NAD(P)+)